MALARSCFGSRRHLLSSVSGPAHNMRDQQQSGEEAMSATPTSRRARRYCCAVVVSAIAVLGNGLATSAFGDSDSTTDSSKTGTPIKHVIVVLGRKRGVDPGDAPYFP